MLFQREIEGLGYGAPLGIVDLGELPAYNPDGVSTSDQVHRSDPPHFEELPEQRNVLDPGADQLVRKGREPGGASRRPYRVYLANGAGVQVRGGRG